MTVRATILGVLLPATAYDLISTWPFGGRPSSAPASPGAAVVRAAASARARAGAKLRGDGILTGYQRGGRAARREVALSMGALPPNPRAEAPGAPRRPAGAGIRCD